MDIGSQQTWVRCQSCTKGCKAENPLYDSSKSPTYTNSSNLCKGPFNVRYGDKSHINGIWGCDTLTIEAGILGLGKGDLSLPSQSALSMQMFSYFVPPTNIDAGNLLFANEAMMKSHACSNQFTPIVKGPKPSMSSYTLQENFDKLMDTWYSFDGNEQIVLPEIKFHIGEGTSTTTDVTLSYYGILWMKNDRVKCLAFAAKESNELYWLTFNRVDSMCFMIWKGKELDLGVTAS
ncbi:aspartyl protease AED1-like [Nicotiana sylvestris]|uniref:aspartyl protease AED1-like n=1 Tax=Nicotiana sylvestris TaxID=4096 RepID=UPI00388C4B8B